MVKSKGQAALRYGAHDYISKEVVFVYQELVEQVKAIHAVVFPFSSVSDLPNLCISPVAAIPQVGWRPCLIFDFTWSGLNQATDRVAPEESMRFGSALACIDRQALTTYPNLGPVYLRKVDLANAYMCL